MGGFNPTTLSGHSLYTMRSLLQKAIRRGDLDHAGYAANEMYGGYYEYLWKTLLVISAEDCYGIMTKEIMALKQADDYKNKGKKGDQRDCIFIAKALVLLCLARKNRDGCYVACNFMWSDRELDIGEIPGPNDLEWLKEDYEKFLNVPDYTYDCHTREGRARGKTDVDMVRDEEAALCPHQLSLFDNGSWELSYEEDRKKGKVTPKMEEQLKEFQKGKEADPTHQGEYWPPDHREDADAFPQPEQVIRK